MGSSKINTTGGVLEKIGNMPGTKPTTEAEKVDPPETWTEMGLKNKI